MDILDLLVRDHDRMRGELSRMKGKLSRPEFRNELKNYIDAHALHESMEEELLLPRLETLPAGALEADELFGYEKAHGKIWEILDELMDAVKEEKFPRIQEVFFRFCAVAESHFRYEERELFPKVRMHLEADELKALGEKALHKFESVSQTNP